MAQLKVQMRVNIFSDFNVLLKSIYFIVQGGVGEPGFSCQNRIQFKPILACVQK